MTSEGPGANASGPSLGNASTTQQVATGSGASNQSNGAQANGAGFTAIGQSNDSFVLNPVP
ncbi:hypothetical protein [Streptomyces sp. NPDC051364]|uniref:hypothetical protein n=1 Tax=Streptomyces sp. NPDC051364 TaxID=3155799 RepID=UPI00344580D6